MRSLRYLKDYQEGSRIIPNGQVGRDEQIRLQEGLIKSEVSLNQPKELTEKEGSCGSPIHVNEDDDKLKTCTIREEYQMDLLMVGGIQIFLPFAADYVEVCIADVEVATTEAGQPTQTVREAFLQTLEASLE
jgi:hypothetical protein